MHWVFAYGSNMHLPDLGRWLRAGGYGDAEPLRVEPACIPDFALTWNYRSVVRRGGAANVTPRSGGELRGVALLVDDALLEALDAKEGHPSRYDRGGRPVRTQLLRAAESVEAWLYRATAACTSPHPEPPRAAYLRLLVDAAERHELGAAYVERLRSTPTIG